MLRYRAALGRAIDAFDPAIVHTNGLKMHCSAPGESARAVGPASSGIFTITSARARRPTRLLRWHHRAAGHGRHQFGRASPPMRAARWPTARAWSRSGTPSTSIAFLVGPAPRANLDAMAGLPQAPADTRSRRARRDAGALERTRDISRSDRAAAAAICPSAPTSSATRCIRPRAASIRSTSFAQLARSLGVADRVGFTGFVHSPEATFRALDVVVHASTAPEPFGLVIAEAMACGRAGHRQRTPAARRRSSRRASTRSSIRRATPPIWRDKIAALAGDADLRARLGTRRARDGRTRSSIARGSQPN